MGIPFEINLCIYPLMIMLEMLVIRLLASKLSGIELDKKRTVLGLMLITCAIFLLDIFVFKMHKNGVRSLLQSIMLIVFIYRTSQSSLTKSFIQFFMVFVYVLASDLLIQLLTKSMFDSYRFAEKNFTIMYALYIFVLYLGYFVLRHFRLKLMDLNKIRI